MNDLAHVTVEAFAISDASDTDVDFDIENVGVNSHLSVVQPEHFSSNVASTTLRVPVTTLDDYCKNNNLSPTLIKIDLESAEVMVLQGMREVMDNNKPKIIVSTHGDGLPEECRKILLEHGYDVDGLRGFHHELIAMTSESSLRA